MSATSERIVAILNRRYPCQALPTGALTEIGNEVGVTREYVRQVANAHGWGGRIHKGRPHSNRLCARCGETTPAGNSIYCRECLWVELPCGGCSAPVRRRVSLLVAQAGTWGERNRQAAGATGGYTGLVFCNGSCRGKYVAAHYGWGSGHGKNRARKQAVAQ